VALVGGSLQGVEAAYLAHKAGWETLLIDKKSIVPASGLCDIFVQLDVTQIERLDPVFKNVDLVIPTTENAQALNSLVQWSRSSDIPLVFDADAYKISSSKRESDRLFAGIGIPAPLPWPGCGFPLIAKPVSGSGSKNIQLFHNQKQLEKRFPSLPTNDWVLQEYVEGPSYSLEIIGHPHNYTALQVTDLEMDDRYDCKRVQAPTQLSLKHITQLEKISLKIAKTLQLKGLMDVEVILHNNQLKVLEIDARLPSQTPTAVYWSSGINMLELLAQFFLKKQKLEKLNKSHREHRGHREKISHNSLVLSQSQQGVIYEHIKVTSDAVEVCGEHIMTQGGPLKLHTDFFGADEAITNYAPGQNQWIAALIIPGINRSQACQKRNQIIKNIQDHFKLNIFKDFTPKNVAIANNNDYNSTSRNKTNKVEGLDLSSP
ncbi:MAG: 3-methylornithine--L-lysine ligase PylC, partial [Candidatus Aminicenantes bacterium]